MKLFPQLALVSAIAISGNAMAMQALDDDSLSAATGQDGITIAIKPPTAMFDAAATGGPFAATAGMAGVIAIDKIYVHDKDGANDNAIVPTANSAAGAIVLDGFKIAGSAPIVVKIDSDSNAGEPLLNINVALPSTLVIRTGAIGVASSNRTTAAVATNANIRGVLADTNSILDSFDINLGGASLNIQLGAEAQGAMIKVAGTITNGLTITGINLKDETGVAAAAAVPATSPRVLGTKGGSIYLGSINITDTGTVTGASNGSLGLAADIDVSANGLIVKVGGVASDILMTDVRLGNVAASAALGNLDTTKSIGDIEIVGMSLSGTQIAISGH